MISSLNFFSKSSWPILLKILKTVPFISVSRPKKFDSNLFSTFHKLDVRVGLLRASCQNLESLIYHHKNACNNVA